MLSLEYGDIIMEYGNVLIEIWKCSHWSMKMSLESGDIVTGVCKCCH